METTRSTTEQLFGVTPPPPVFTETKTAPEGGGGTPLPWILLILCLTMAGGFVLYKIVKSEIKESEGRVMAAIPKMPDAEKAKPEETIANQTTVNPPEQSSQTVNTPVVTKDRSDYLL